MCEICNSEGKDFLYVNGAKKQITTYQLYKVYREAVAPVRLCYIHGIELFMIGEKRFLREHLLFAKNLAMRSRKISPEKDSPFGF